MIRPEKIKFRSIAEFWDHLPEDERILVDVLRQIVKGVLPEHYTEKLAYNVPFYYGKRRICLIWPASVKGGGFKRGVMLGFCQGNRLRDTTGYLEHGTNKVVYYKIFHSVEEIDEYAIRVLLEEAVSLDMRHR